MKSELINTQIMRQKYAIVSEDTRRAHDLMIASFNWVNYNNFSDQIDVEKSVAKKSQKNDRITLNRTELSKGGYNYGFTRILTFFSLACLLIASIELVGSLKSEIPVKQMRTQVELILVATDIWNTQALLISEMTNLVVWGNSYSLDQKLAVDFFEEKLKYFKIDLLDRFRGFKSRNLGSNQENFSNKILKDSYCLFLKDKDDDLSQKCGEGASSFLKESIDKLLDQIASRQEIFIKGWRSMEQKEEGSGSKAKSFWRDPNYKVIQYFMLHRHMKGDGVINFFREDIIETQLANIKIDIDSFQGETVGIRIELIILVYFGMIFWMGFGLLKETIQIAERSYGIIRFLPFDLMKKNPWLINMIKDN